MILGSNFKISKINFMLLRIRFSNCRPIMLDHSGNSSGLFFKRPLFYPNLARYNVNKI